MKLTFEPVTNKVGDKYFIVPKNDTEGVKCVMCCDSVGAFMVNLLTENHNRDEMLEAVAKEYPQYSAEEIETAVDGVRAILRSTVEAKSNESENEGAEAE